MFDLLAYLLAHRDRVVTREELLAQIWGHDFVSEATLSSRVKAARKALGDSGREQALIRTVRGRGYQFVGSVEEVAATDGATGTVTGSAPPALVARAEAAEVHGRETELGHLARLLDAAIEGTRQFVLVTGEPGAGKTTLVERFVAEAAAGSPLLVASGRCLEQRGAVEPYMPVLEAVGDLCRRSGSDQVLGTLSRLAPTWLSQLPGLSTPPGAEAQAEPEPAAEAASDPRPERMLREMTAALEALAEKVPVVLVLDDLHWADASTLALLAHVARRSDPARLLIIGPARPITGGPVDELRRELRPRGNCVDLALPPISPDGVHAYLAERYPGAEPLAAVVHQRTDGNPLFIDCVLRSWVDAGAIEAVDGTWEVRAAEDDLASDVPETLRELLEQDVARLSAEDQRALEVASVAGADFSAAAVAAGLSSDPEAAEIRCAELARLGRFLRQGDAEEWPDGTIATKFAFVHDLHRQVLYERITAGRRTRLHRDIAARLESAYGADPSGPAAELANHFLEAREPTNAVRYLQLAAERALTRGGHRDAVNELSAALDLVARTPDLPDRDRREMSLRAALGSALIATEGWSSAAAEEALGRGLELARSLGDGRSVAVLLYTIAAVHEYRGEYPASAALLDEALRLEGAESDPARQLAAHELMACSLFHQGSFDQAVEQAERGLAVHEPGLEHRELAFTGEEPAASCNDWAGLALWCLGYPDQALERIRAAVELAAQPGREYGLANARMQAARLHQLRLEPREALTESEATVALADERGFSYQVAAGAILQGWAMTALGSHDEGIDRMREGLDAHRATGAEMDRPYFLGLLADGCRLAGRPEDGLAAVDEALAMVAGDRTFFYEPELHRLRGSLTLAAQGAERRDAAAASFTRALDVARHQRARSLERRAADSLAELEREAGAERRGHPGAGGGPRRR